MKLIIDITHPIQTASGWLDLHFSGEFEEGESCALFGSSGAGKTTILRIISGLLVPQSGYIQMGD
ncbi:MAG: ATP-binding cassette domain-containing protein, partial [Helicobacter sp.]|nr:ATP-binding cassette domain-containing protein [Helicobacter sp.]